jgi:uncharacterized protein YjbJ (UPF0337 family)
MGIKENGANATQDLKAKVKEVVGSVTKDDKLQSEGRADRAMANLKAAGDHLVKAASHVVDSITGR